MSAPDQSGTAHPPKTLRARRSIYLGAAIILVLAAGWLVSLETREAEVLVVRPLRQDIVSTVASSGVVVPVHDYPVRANFGGLVEKVYVHVGQTVHAGQLLVKMKDQYATARLDHARATLQDSELILQNAEQNGTEADRIGDAADLARAESDRDAAAESLVSLRKLEKRGSVSQAEVLNGARQLELANIALNSLRGRLVHRYTAADIAGLRTKVRASRDDLAAERVSWGNANITAPIAGTVYSVPVLPFAFVPMGADLVYVADLTKFEIRANFFEDDLSRLRVGEPVSIQWDGDSARSWRGTLVSEPMAVDRSGPVGVGHCIILLTSPRDDLPIDSNVTVVVQTAKHTGALTIPHQALHDSGPDKFVYTVSDGRLRQVPVTVGLVNDMTVEITSGLTGSDDVVIRAYDGSPLRGGRRVKIADTNHS